MTQERDYVLGTNDEELQRLGLQHRIWRKVVLECWKRAGIGPGCQVLDAGAGPGYATMDLAEIVGLSGHVTAVERSNKFVQALRGSIEKLGLKNVTVHEVDLMADELPRGDFDFSWCRWVNSFVSDPAILVARVARALKPGGRAIFHEYGHYRSWQFSPRSRSQEEFVEHVVESWRETGGRADVALDIPPMLAKNGMRLHSMTPHIFCIRPNDEMWQWPATFIETGPDRLRELGRIDQQFVDRLRADFARFEAEPNAVMVTPLVVEIVAEKMS
jgi:SAM-dependent methyltransferase